MTTADLKALPLPEPVAYPSSEHDSQAQYTAEQMRAYAAAAVAQERERCARVCEALRDQWRPEYGPYDSGRLTGLENAAAAIREG